MDPFSWIYLAVMLVAMAYSYAHQPKIEQPTALTLEDLKIPTAELGKEIPVLFGTRDLKAPEVVWYGDLRTSPVRVSSGK